LKFLCIFLKKSYNSKCSALFGLSFEERFFDLEKIMKNKIKFPTPRKMINQFTQKELKILSIVKPPLLNQLNYII
jgi:hypothetical protein